MQWIEHALQGPLAYILVFQLLLVSGLIVFLLWLVLSRMKDSVLVEEGGVSSSHSNPTNHIEQGAKYAANAGHLTSEQEKKGVPSEKTPSSSTVETSQVAAPKPVLVEEPAVKKAAQSSSDESSAPKEDTSALKKQIEFLEGKLLEYQIIQDEIASLSTLKQENEKLRQEIMGLQRTATTAPTAAPTPPASAPLEEGPGPTSFSSPQDPSEVSAKNQIDSLIQKIDELSDKK